MRSTTTGNFRKRRLLLFPLVCLFIFPLPGQTFETEKTLTTHQMLTAMVSSRTKWLLTAPMEKGATETNATLLAFTVDGDFHPITFRKRGETFRAHVQNYPVPSDLSAEVRPTQLPDGSFVGAGKSGMFINVDTIERRWLFVWPSVRPSTRSQPAVLGRDDVAMVGVDGSLLLFQKTEDKWFQTQRIASKMARISPEAVLAAVDLDGDGGKELIAPARPIKRNGRVLPTEIHAYRFHNNSLDLMSTYAAGENAVFETASVTTADLNNDGEREILVTRSERDGAASHLVLEMKGRELVLKARSDTTRTETGNARARLLGAFNIDRGTPKILALEGQHPARFLLALRLSGGRLRERARVAGFAIRRSTSQQIREFALLRRRGIVEVVAQQAGLPHLSAFALFGNRWHFRWSQVIPSSVRSDILTADFNVDAKDDIAFVDQSGLVHIYLSK